MNKSRKVNKAELLAVLRGLPEFVTVLAVWIFFYELIRMGAVTMLLSYALGLVICFYILKGIFVLTQELFRYARHK